LTEIPKRNPVTIVLAKTVVTYFIELSSVALELRKSVCGRYGFLMSIVRAKTTLPQYICNLLVVLEFKYTTPQIRCVLCQHSVNNEVN
jgi:hypothetical protein